MKKIFIAAGLILTASTAGANEELQSIENIAQELVEVRQEIEVLHNKIGFEKEAYRDQMRSYSNQKSDLEVRVSRAELNNKELQKELERLTAVNEEKAQTGDELKPVLLRSISKIRESLDDSIPFKLEARKAALNEIEHKLETNIITPGKATNQLWAFVEDELMLGRSSGIYRDALKIDGESKLVRMLRLGKVAMFYKTQDGQVGVMRKKGSEWKQEEYQKDEDIAQINTLFDAYAKNINNGLYKTPNFLPKN
jgi:hypothetical protein